MIKIKNIWHLYYILFSFLTITFIYIAYLSYSSILENNKTLTSSYNKIFYNSLDTTLSQNEVLLDTLGHELFDLKLYKDKEKSKYLLQKALKNSKYVIGFGLTDTNGNLLVTSANIDTSKVHNILKDEAVKTTFYNTLKVDRMVVGRTYFFEPLKTWLIPVRKAIRDEDGNILGVMIAGLVNNKENNIFNGIELYDDRSIGVLHDFDKNGEIYRLFYSHASDFDYEKVYHTALDAITYQHFMDNLKEEFHIAELDKIRDGNVYYTATKVGNESEKILLAVSYNKKYKLWVIVSQDHAFLEKQIIESLVYIFIFYSFIVLMFYFLFKIIDIKEKEREKELVYKANHDSLTGYYNRNYISNDPNIMNSFQEKNLEVIFLDIDNFKNINDRFGHNIGDQVLVGVANRLGSFFEKEDIIIRHGGDEFIILSFSEIDHESLIESISAPCHVEDLEFRLGVSIGISKYPDDSVHINELLSMADIAMHEAKKVRNSYKYFNRDMYQKSIEKSDIEHQLRHALENNEFYMVYQPQITADKKIYGVEALIRWENEKLGFIPPDKFISIAEENGMIVKVGEWIIKQTLSDIKKVWELTETQFQISLNISVIQLMESNFLELLLETIAVMEVDKTLITLEITESLAIEEFNYVIPLLNKIRENGIDISLDDFGTGYSSLSLLKDLPLSELKIDKQFVDDVQKNGENSLIKTIFSIGKNFSFKIVCEGTETKEQIDILKEYGCDIFQGYYFSKPLRKENLIEYIKDFHD